MLLHVILSLFTLSLGTLQGSTSRAINNIAKPNCPTHCGNVTVPYPFGIGNGTGCSIDNSFHVTCNTSYEPPKLFLRSSTIEIYSISDSELRIETGVAYRCYNQDGSIDDESDWCGLNVWPFNRCGYVFLGEEGTFAFHGIRDLYDDSDVVERIKSNVPVVVDWVIEPKGACSESAKCEENSS
ncbi:hypothetical protein L1987_56224 [Smallanthus sonchifolius]|uniref:Uncharacterized protein n=1 Tax=Smallanthus sonchifolius TaxID=185202 RepID=A0ACB9EBT9_9ASTR|nr:hypothetical protein L1987_56224 [Smallanthus sonchifolius]